MTPNLQTSVEYLRGLDWKNIESFDFLQHMGNVTRAYLAECDPTPLTIEDVERITGQPRQEDMETVCIGNIDFGVCGGVVDVAIYDTAPCRVVFTSTLKTHGEFRTFCRMFRIEVKA